MRATKRGRLGVEALEGREYLATTTLDFNAPAGGLGNSGFATVLPTTKGKGFLGGNVSVANGRLNLLTTAGDLWQTRNNQDNALALPTDVSASDFTVQARLASFAVNKNWQNAGIFIGPSEDNYVKLVVGYGGGTSIQLGSEAGAVYSTPAYKTLGLAGINTLDLRLVGTASSKTVAAAYRINSDLDTAWVSVGQASNAGVFSALAKAGVVSTNFGTTPLTVSYDSFALSDGSTVPPQPTGDLVSLQFNAPAGGINNTGFTSVLPTSKGKGLVAGNVSTGNGQLRLTSTAGDLWQTRNTQDNALAVTFDTARDFQADTRLTSFPFTKNWQNAGLFVGTSEDQYVKLVAGYGGGTGIQLGSESGAVFTSAAGAAMSPGNFVSLDLRLQGDNDTKTVVAYYRLNSDADSAWVKLGTVSNAGAFNPAAKAGVLSTNFGTSTAVQTSFNWFTIGKADVTTTPPGPTGPIPITIGTNLDGIAEFSPIAPFIDLTTMFAPWQGAAVNADNYPLGNASAATYAHAYPDGDYQVSYEGQANLAFFGSGASYRVTSVVNGVTYGVLSMKPQSVGGGLNLNVYDVNPADPLRNLHIISPDADLSVSDTFRPVFLQKLAPFDGFLRMMDWMQTNENPTVNWSDRTAPTRFSYVSGTGVPYEVIAKLANTVDKDIWINLPVMATDDYIQRTARLFRDLLEPGRKIYVEYSNELWAYWSHEHAKWNLAHAQSDPAITKTDPWGQSAQGAAKRMVEISNIFRQEWGATKFAAQVRPVLAALVAGASWGEIGLQYIQDRYGKVSDYISALAIGHYVGVINDFAPIDDGSLTLDKLFAWSHNFIDTTLTNWVKQNKVVADKFGLPLHSYEAGQAFAAPYGTNEALKRQAQFDPRMGDVYRHLVTSWTRLTKGGMWGNFATANMYTQYGYWGLLQSITEPGSVKYDAVKQLATETVTV